MPVDDSLYYGSVVLKYYYISSMGLYSGVLFPATIHIND